MNPSIKACCRHPWRHVWLALANDSILPPGSRMKLQLLSGLEKIRIQVELAPLPNAYLMAYTCPVFGLDFKAWYGGHLVSSVKAHSAAAKAGIEPGNMIVKSPP